MKDLEALPCIVHPRAGYRSVCKAASILFVVFGQVKKRNGNYFVCVYITAHDQIRHICTLQAIKDWRWEWPGNEASLLHSLNFLQYSYMYMHVFFFSLGRNSISDVGATALAAALEVNTTLQTLE